MKRSNTEELGRREATSPLRIEMFHDTFSRSTSQSDHPETFWIVFASYCVNTNDRRTLSNDSERQVKYDDLLSIGFHVDNVPSEDHEDDAEIIHVTPFELRPSSGFQPIYIEIHDEEDNGKSRHKPGYYHNLGHSTQFDPQKEHNDYPKPVRARATIKYRRMTCGVALMLRCRRCRIKIEVSVKDSLSVLEPSPTISRKGRVLTTKKVKIDEISEVSKVRASCWAAGNGWKKGLEILLSKAGKGDQLQSSEGRSALSWAAGNGQDNTSQVLIREKDLNIRDNQGRTALSWAAGNGHKQAVRMLLDQNALVNDDDNEGRSPLWWATEHGHRSVVELLLERSAMINTDIPDTKGHNNFFRAFQKGHKAILHILVQNIIQHSGTPGHEDSNSFAQSHICEAAKEGFIDFIQTLINSDVIQGTAFDYSKPLCLASQNGRLNIVELLLMAGANPNSEHEGDTVLYLSVQAGHQNIVKLLLDSGASTGKPCFSGTMEDLVKHDHTLAAMLRAADKEGTLAQNKEQTHDDTDGKFKALINSFELQESGIKFVPDHPSIKDLLDNPCHELRRRPANFQWIHLPANNMRWVELLLVRLYDDSNRAYQILKPERWVRRQHHGAAGKPYARFMRPLCQEFISTSLALGTSVQSVGSESRRHFHRPDLAIFMLFLHWDVNDLSLERQSAWDSSTKIEGSTTTICSAEQELVHNYLNNADHTYHYLHIRRTLDQYYYHTLSDTTSRDNDQVLTRYQRNSTSIL